MTGIFEIIQDAFDLILKDEDQRPAALRTTESFPDFLSRSVKAKHADLIPESFNLVPSKDGEARSICREDYVKSIHCAAALDGKPFHTQNTHHLDLATPLYLIFRDIVPEELLQFLKISQSFVKNQDVLRHAFMMALQRRQDIHIPAIPAQITYAPHMYFDFGGLKYETAEDGCLMVKPKFDYECDTNVDVEARVDYFRCDAGICAHHKHWHEAYMDSPGQGDMFPEGERSYRGGELFFYMHSQMLARYNFERLSNGLSLTEPLNDFHAPMPEGHFNRLTTDLGEKLWDSRAPNTKMTNVNVEGMGLIQITDLELARDRLYDAIDRQFCFVKKIVKGEVKEKLEKLNSPYEPPETEQDVLLDYGIDKLGDMVWSYPHRSVNPAFYGNLHNHGHMVLAYSHDPNGLYHRSSNAGPMGAHESAVRDAIFFRWHAFIDDLFQRYKATLPEYDIERELGFENITIDQLAIEQVGGTTQDSLPVLETNWYIDRVDISMGIPQERKPWLNTEKVWYQFIHIGHEEFKFKLNITNSSDQVKFGTVRIFMAPYYRSYYRNKEPMFNELRRMFIELDKFVVKLNPGQNEFEQSSKNSNVTVPTEQLFMTTEHAMKLLGNAVENPTDGKGNVRVDAAWCGCGWPEYALIGKGKKNGFKCCLFAMITDFEKDQVDPPSTTSCCIKLSMSYCGRRNKRYPDRKPMGFPFDRNIAKGDMSLDGFMTKTRNEKEMHPEMISNMKKIDFIVKHVGEREQPLPGPTMPKLN